LAVGGNNYPNGLWFGLTDRAVEGTWLWIDGTNAADDDVLWLGANPNNVNDNQHCGRIITNEGYLMDDEYCTNSRYALCEKPVCRQ